MSISLERPTLEDDYLKAIGKIAVLWSYLEIDVEVAIWAFSGLSVEQGMALTTHIKIIPRLDMLETIGNTLADPKYKSSIQDLVARARRILPERNRIIHANWACTIDETPSVWKPQAKGKLQITVTKTPVSEIESIATAIEGVLTDLQALISSKGNPHRA